MVNPIPRRAPLQRAYFVDSVEDAVNRARVDLGPDAVLLSKRDTPPQHRHLGAFKVVFGLRAPASDSVCIPGQAMADFRDRVSHLRQMVADRRSARQASNERGGWGNTIEDCLVTNGVAP